MRVELAQNRKQVDGFVPGRSAWGIMMRRRICGRVDGAVERVAHEACAQKLPAIIATRFVVLLGGAVFGRALFFEPIKHLLESWFTFREWPAASRAEASPGAYPGRSGRRVRGIACSSGARDGSTSCPPCRDFRGNSRTHFASRSDAGSGGARPPRRGLRRWAPPCRRRHFLRT